MRKNKFLLCLVLIGILCFGAITAYAVNTDGDYQGGSLNTAQSGSGSTLYPSPYFDGIRVSFVKSDGTRVASRDFIDDAQYNSNVNTVVKTASTICSRPSYSNGKCSLSWNGGVSIGSVTRPVSELQALFTVQTTDGKKYSFPVSVAPKVASNSYTSMFDGLYREKNSSLSQEDYDKFIYQLFTNMLSSFGASDTNLENYIVKGEKQILYDLFLVFEPVTVVRMNGSHFMGTAYELGVEGKKQKGGGWKNSSGESPCKGSSSGALCDLSSVLRKSIPCKSYLDGNIIDSMKEKESTILINNFPDGYYFKNIKIDYSNSQSQCSNKSGRLSIEAVTGNYGVGMGVVWISDIYSGPLNDCNTIYEKIGFENNNPSNALFAKFKNAFDTNDGGTQAIYNLYPSGVIDYLDGSGNVDVKWFVNECTCFGMYEHYANTTVATYKNNNQSSINNFSSIFGSADWFVDPELTLTKGWIINGRFEADFATFNQAWKTYSESKGLEWADKTANDYTDALQCGTTEDYWCEQFETWYRTATSNYSGLRGYPSIDTIKRSSLAIINSRYKEQLQTMIDAYNLNYSLANGFKWTLDADDGNGTFSYIKNCVSADTASCQSIINFYQQNQGTDLNNLACDRLESFDFSAYNNRYGTDITGQWFVAECGCTQATSYNCTPNYSVGSCTNNDDIIYTDSSNGIIEDDYWKNCVFDDIGDYDIDPHKVSDHGSDLTYYENGLGSQYCEVYCIEDLSASLAKPNINVEAGSRFTWGYSKVEGSRTCKTKTVEWDKFEDDLKAANEDIVRKYVEWQLEIKYADAISNANVSENQWKTSPAGCGDGVSCGANEEGCTPKKETHSCKCGGCKPKTTCTYTGSTVEYAASTSSKYGYYEYADDQRVSWSETYNGHISCPSPSSFVSSMTDVKAKKKAYDGDDGDGGAVGYAQSLVDDMKACYTWDQNTVYEVDPQAKIFYNDDINYNYSDDLEKTTSYSFSDESVCEADIAEQIKGCSGESCPTTDVSMKNCSGDDRYVQMTRRATTRFLLKENVFRYVLKSNHLSVHPDKLPSGGEFTTNYIDIGFSNFPVSFSAPEGLYGTKHNRGQFDVEYSNLGHVESGKTAIDTIMSGSAISQGTDEEYGKWICEYRVYADLLPEDPDDGGAGDIDLIYRPIDLYNPFPDIDASHRDTGDNWCDQNGDCSNDNFNVQTYISGNRGVDYDEVYSLEPMYTFILTPSIIKEIREYNDSNSYTSYTGRLGTAQYFDYVCEEGTGQACVSYYLSYIIDITGAKNQPGTCVADQFRNTNYEDYADSFYGCRY